MCVCVYIHKNGENNIVFPSIVNTQLHHIPKTKEEKETIKTGETKQKSQSSNRSLTVDMSSSITFIT